MYQNPQRRRKLMTLVLLVTALYTPIGNGDAPGKPVANLDVEEIVSFSNGLFIFRAAVIADKDRNYNLILEKIAIKKSKPLDLVSTWNLKDLKGSESLEIKKGKRILGLKTSIAGFEFDYSTVKAPFVISKHCVINIVDQAPIMTCDE